MIDTLDHYIHKSLPDLPEDPEGIKHAPVFQTGAGLNDKVDKNGRFLPFWGNTTVFLLNDSVKQTLKQQQDALYGHAGWMLAEPLDEATFHMTLHDLVSGTQKDDTLARRMDAAEQAVRHILPRWKDAPPVHMEGTWLFNMVNTSIVLGLKPSDRESHRRLDEMYTALESAVSLNRALTPHITMAYFRPGAYYKFDLDALGRALKPVKLELTLSMEDLVFQTFRDMNHYETVF